MVIKKKYSKKGSIAFAAALLSGVAITSAVFAGWIIINGDTKTADGTINVDTVELQNHKITIAEGYKGSIKFGASKEGVTPPTWLKVTKGSLTEKLTEKFTFTVSDCKDDDYNTISNLFEPITLTTNNDTKYREAVTNKYVGELPTWNNGITLAQVGETTVEGVRTYSLEIEFKWGEAFGFDNPTEYANSLTNPSNDDKTAFNNNLKGLYDSLNGITYTLTITTK